MCQRTSRLTPLQQDIVQESFQTLQRMIYRLALSHQKQYGGDLDELYSKAIELFLLAHARHDAQRGKLTTCVYVAVKNGLKDLSRKERRRRRNNKIISFEELATQDNPIEIPQKQKEPNIGTLLMEMGEDCKNIVYLILFPPMDLYQEINNYNNPMDWENCLEEYLKFHMKWTNGRIHKAFRELQQTLTT